MTAEPARVRRLLRLERVRAIARQNAASEAAQAEGTLAQLEALIDRTRSMADAHAGRQTHADGFALRQSALFVAGLEGICATVGTDALQARQHADLKQQELAQAERRRAAVEARAQDESRALAKRSALPVLVGRRPIGTPLE